MMNDKFQEISSTFLKTFNHDHSKKDTNLFKNFLEYRAELSDARLNRELLKQLIKEYAAKSKELERANEIIQEKNEKLNVFLGIAAHDLRSPIGINKMYSEVILTTMGDNLDPQVVDMVQIIKERAEFMLVLLDDLLDFSKIEAGKLTINSIEGDYIKFLNKVYKNGKLIAESKRIFMELDLSETSIYLSFDPYKIEQVLNNLITNSIKFSNPESLIKIKVFVNEDSVITEVHDQGVGIPEDTCERLFGFFDAEGTVGTAGEKSHGLGLAICKKIIDTHLGTIGVKSVEGKGSNFHFSLPLKGEKNE